MLNPRQFFARPRSILHRQYEALRAFFMDRWGAKKVAQSFGYQLSTFYSMTRDFRQLCRKHAAPAEQFFVTPTAGRKPGK